MGDICAKLFQILTSGSGGKFMDERSLKLTFLLKTCSVFIKGVAKKIYSEAKKETF